MSKFRTFLVFAGGIVVGALITQIAFAKFVPIDILKKASDGDDDDETENDDNDDDRLTEEDVIAYEDMVDSLPYKKASVSRRVEDSRMMNKHDHITYISSYEFGEDPDYDQIGLTYYGNQDILTLDHEIINDPTEYVGIFKEHFGEFDEDCVYVKNDSTKAYYEIVYSYNDCSILYKNFTPALASEVETQEE